MGYVMRNGILFLFLIHSVGPVGDVSSHGNSTRERSLCFLHAVY